jgi:hypothetical protein
MTDHAAERKLPERARYLVLLAGAPTVWALHFLACYLTVAIWCARYAGYGGSLEPVGTVIIIYTTVALAAIAFIGWGGYRRHRYGASSLPHDFDGPEDRHRFLGFATFLLAGLSTVATIFVAIAASSFDGCR